MTTQRLTCSNCGDAFDGPERDCPKPSPGRPLVDCGRGGHMFEVAEVDPPDEENPGDLVAVAREMVEVMKQGPDDFEHLRLRLWKALRDHDLRTGSTEMAVLHAAEELHAARVERRSFLAAAGRVVQEAKHHHRGRGLPLEGQGGISPGLLAALRALEEVTTPGPAALDRPPAPRICEPPAFHIAVTNDAATCQCGEVPASGLITG